MSIPRRLISKLDEAFRGDKDFRRSPPRHLLKSNATPSDSEAIAIRALITEAEASIEELHRFPTRDHASQVIESQLFETIERYRALLSPVRYLPTEILQEIFYYYADSQGPDITIGTMPWRLGHISHRWRKIALSLRPLWNNTPKIYLSYDGFERSYVRALIWLFRRSGTTLKLSICHRFSSSAVLRKGYESHRSIIKKILLHSKRIEQLCIEVNLTTMPLLQGFKGRLPNLRILRVLHYDPLPNIDVFKTAPALRQVTIVGSYQDNSVRVLLPWSQITHFEDERDGRVGKLVLFSSSSLRSLTNLHIYRIRCPYQDDESALLYPYRPTALPNLRTLRIVIYHRDYKDVDLFLESLTIPAVEVIKIHYMRPLIPHLISMISGFRGLSRLQKLAFRTIPLQTGELGALLKLTPHLIELDIDIPPVGDLLRLIYSEGEIMLVPMLQALCMHIPASTTGAQIEHLDTLAQVRCELGFRKDSEDATILSLRPRTWTTLHTLRVIFDSRGSWKSSRKILNNWSSSFSPGEDKVIDMLQKPWFRDGDFTDRDFLKNILSRIESYEITNKVLHVGVFF